MMRNCCYYNNNYDDDYYYYYYSYTGKWIKSHSAGTGTAFATFGCSRVS